jgi:hypothetical protein
MAQHTQAAAGAVELQYQQQVLVVLVVVGLAPFQLHQEPPELLIEVVVVVVAILVRLVLVALVLFS